MTTDHEVWLVRTDTGCLFTFETPYLDTALAWHHFKILVTESHGRKPIKHAWVTDSGEYKVKARANGETFTFTLTRQRVLTQADAPGGGLDADRTWRRVDFQTVLDRPAPAPDGPDSSPLANGVWAVEARTGDVLSSLDLYLAESTAQDVLRARARDLLVRKPLLKAAAIGGLGEVYIQGRSGKRLTPEDLETLSLSHWPIETAPFAWRTPEEDDAYFGALCADFQAWEPVDPRDILEPAAV